MNHPYPELLRDITARNAALAEYNAGIERARQEYRINPIAACGVRGCWRLVNRPSGRLCSSHGRANGRTAA